MDYISTLFYWFCKLYSVLIRNQFKQYHGKSSFIECWEVTMDYHANHFSYELNRKKG